MTPEIIFATDLILALALAFGLAHRVGAAVVILNALRGVFRACGALCAAWLDWLPPNHGNVAAQWQGGA